MTTRRIRREWKTVLAMMRIHCRGVHGTKKGLCAECEDLREYAQQRLDKCPLAADKPTCAKCPIHCYKPEMREKIRAVMRYAGPRMTWRHPILAMRHLIDGRRKTKKGG
ncbi:MAG: nitrous oxide-stimulated promoter family protein [Planctomycetota bacterium]|jgi:predicted amidophosphoribosyltransferase